MFSKIILGAEPWLSMAIEDWQLIEPGSKLIPIEIKLNKNFVFDVSQLDEYHAGEATGFVAWGPDFLNFQRLELVGQLKKKGFKMPALIHPSAQVSASAKCQENVWVQALSYVGPNTFLEFNSCISVGTKIGSSVSIQKSVWLGQSSIIKSGATVGAHSALGDGVQVLNNINIGRQVRIDSACVVDKDVPEKTFRIRNSNLQGVIVKI
jgi:UDP-3-O-[3-hydroxymyristoyl] glucosamine N-acyltransferase